MMQQSRQFCNCKQCITTTVSSEIIKKSLPLVKYYTLFMRRTKQQTHLYIIIIIYNIWSNSFRSQKCLKSIEKLLLYTVTMHFDCTTLHYTTATTTAASAAAVVVIIVVVIPHLYYPDKWEKLLLNRKRERLQKMSSWICLAFHSTIFE